MWRMALDNCDVPKTLAAIRRLKREFETIRMAEVKDPLMFFGRVDKAADELAMLCCGKSVEDVNRHIVHNLSLSSVLFRVRNISVTKDPRKPQLGLVKAVSSHVLSPWQYVPGSKMSRNVDFERFWRCSRATLISRNQLLSRFWLLTTAVWCIRRPHTPHSERASTSRAPVSRGQL